MAFRGGGSKGAYEVGVLNGILKKLHPDDYAYDVVTGVSVGAVNAGIFAKYPKG